MKRKGKLSSKLLFSVLSATVFVMVLLSFVFFFLYQNKMKEKYRELIYNTISNVDVVFDGYMNNAGIMAVQLYQSPEGVLCRLDPNYKIGENVRHILLIQDMLQQTPYMHSVSYINHEEEISLIVFSGISYITGFEMQAEKMCGLSMEERHLFWSAPDYYNQDIHIPILTVVYADVPASSIGYEGMVAVNIDLQAMSKKLFASEEKKDTTLFILDASGNVISHSDASKVGENWADQEMFQSILEGKNQFNNPEESSGNCEINWIGSRQSDYYVVAQTRFNNDSGVGILLIILFAAFLLFIIFNSFIISKTLNPLTGVVAEMSTSGFGIEGFYDELEFLRRYHAGISTQIEKLNGRLYKEMVVRNLAMGVGNEVIWPMLTETNMIRSDKRNFFIMVFIQKKSEQKENLADYEEVKNQICEMCGFALMERGTVEYFDISIRRILFLLSADKDDDCRSVQELLEEKKLEVETSVRNFTLLMVLSEAITEEKDICRIYRNVSGCLQTKLLLDDVRTVPIVGAEPLPKSMESIISAMVQAVVQKKYDEYSIAAEGVLFECREVPYEKFCDILMALWDAVDNVNLIHKSRKDKVKYREQVREQILKLNSRMELLCWLDNLYSVSEQHLARIHNHSANNTLEDVVEYIQNHYGDYGLNVNFLAEKMHLSVQHFSRIFRESTGNSVLEYITKVRMEKASEILILNPNMNMADVAEKLGYANGAYFAQVFKKYYGVSPAKYRDYYAVSNHQRNTTEDGSEVYR